MVTAINARLNKEIKFENMKRLAELKPFAKKIKDALDSGDAYYKNTAGKYTFVYKLKKKKGRLKQSNLF